MDWWQGQFAKIGDTVATYEYWLGIATSIGLLFLHHRIKLPRVKITGGGGGATKLDNGETFGNHRLTVFSSPHFFGYPIKRDDLVIQSARVYDPAHQSYEGHLMRWQGEPDERPFQTTIGVGQSKGLYICGVYDKRVHHYSGSTLNNIELSETLVELGQTRKLEIHIFDILGRCYKIPFRVSAEERRNHAQKVQVSIIAKTTLMGRVRQVRNGFRVIWDAFTRPSY